MKLRLKARSIRALLLLAMCSLLGAGLALQATGAPTPKAKMTAEQATRGGPLHRLAQIANHTEEADQPIDALMGLAIDGATALTGVVTMDGDPDEGNWSLSSRIITQNIATGKRRTIFSRRSTVIGGLVAGHGHAYALIYRVISFKKPSARVQLVELTGDPLKPRLISSETVRFKDFCYPARLTDVTEAGEAVLLRPVSKSDCNRRGLIELIASDKSRRTVVQRAEMMGPAVSAGDRLLYSVGSRLRSSKLATGETVDYWWGTYSNITMSSTGDLMLTTSEDSDDDFDVAYGRGDDEPAALLSIPAGSPAAATVEPRLPRNRVALGVYCGSGHVRLLATEDGVGDFFTEEDDYGYSFFMRIFASNRAFNAYVGGPVGVELRGNDGKFVRSLGVIDRGEILQPECSGNTLTVPVLNDKTISYRQFDAS